MEWTKKAVTKRMAEANKKGFIAISDGMYRNDDVFFIAMPTFPIRSDRSKHINQRQCFSLMRDKKREQNMEVKLK